MRGIKPVIEIPEIRGLGEQRKQMQWFVCSRDCWRKVYRPADGGLPPGGTTVLPLGCVFDISG